MMKVMDIAGWDERYRTGPRAGNEVPTPLLQEFARGLNAGAALDLACGTGRHALFLASLGWRVVALDGSSQAVAILQERAREERLDIQAGVCDLSTSPLPAQPDGFDLIVIAYYLQRDLYPRVKSAVRPGGLVLAIAHISEPDEPPSYKRAERGELRAFFDDWQILHDYEGASRDPAHKRPVAEIAARRPVKIKSLP